MPKTNTVCGTQGPYFYCCYATSALREPTELKVVHLVLGMLGSRRAKFKRLLVSTEGDKYQEVLTAVCPRYVCGDDVTDTGIQCGSG